MRNTYETIECRARGNVENERAIWGIQNLMREGNMGLSSGMESRSDESKQLSADSVLETD